MRALAVSLFLSAIAGSAAAQGLPACETGELAGGGALDGPCVITRAAPSVETVVAGGQTVKVYRPLGVDEVGAPAAKTLSPETPAKLERQKGVAVYRGVVTAPPPRLKPRAAPAPEPAAAPRPTCQAALIRRPDRRDGDRRYDICVDNLDALNDPAEVRALYNRVLEAARLACPIDGRRLGRFTRGRCILELTDEAVEAAGIAPLALYHERFRRREFDNRIAIVGPQG